MTSVSSPGMLITGINPFVLALVFILMVHACLKEGRNVEIIREGHKALIKHQDSLSESDFKGENLSRPKKKKEKNKEKENGENKPENEGNSEKKGNPLYLVLEKFAKLDLSDNELDSDEEENLEKATAEYEEEKYGWRWRPPPYNISAGVNVEPTAPSGPHPPPATPSYLQTGGGCCFIRRDTWARLASAFPVFEDPQTNNRYHTLLVILIILRDVMGNPCAGWGPGARHHLCSGGSNCCSWSLSPEMQAWPFQPLQVEGVNGSKPSFIPLLP
nr:uncharacterized protein LOC121830165 [Peromyscus maniculatus bairdii]